VIARILAAAALLACVAALPAAAQNFTSPPRPDQYVTDKAGALSAAATTALDNELAAYESKTGHRILVWIGDSTGSVPLETWTTQTADTWKVGRKGHDDGAVLFLFMKDHKVRIEVGYGLEGTLTDADSARIISDDIVPRMRANDVDGAVEAGIGAILTTVTPSYAGSPVPTPASSDESDNSSPWIGLIVAIVVLIVFIIVIVQIVATIRYGYLITREGAAAARKQIPGWWWLGVGSGIGSGIGSGSSGGGFSGGSFGGGGLSGGGFGGGFGGGGASGSW
jgi:uncharacterized protein